MGSPVEIRKNDSLTTFLDKNVVRFSMPAVAPTLITNTFPAGYTSTLLSPVWRFSSKGTAVESGHSCLFAFERDSTTTPSVKLPDANAAFLTRRFEIRARIATYTATPGNVTTGDAFGGLSVFNPGVTVPNYLTATGVFVQVRQNLVSRGTWTLYVNDGGGSEYSYPFSVPDTPNGGHNVKLVVDCVRDYVAAVVDGISVVANTLPTGTLNPLVIDAVSFYGLVLFAGTTQSAATQSVIQGSSFSTVILNA